jgi:hypothetical protein
MSAMVISQRAFISFSGLLQTTMYRRLFYLLDGQNQFL